MPTNIFRGAKVLKKIKIGKFGSPDILCLHLVILNEVRNLLRSAKQTAYPRVTSRRFFVPQNDKLKKARTVPTENRAGR